MADQTATLAVGIDSSGAQAGAQVFVRSATEIRAAAEASGASVDRLSASARLIEDAYAGVVGASDMAADRIARATLATEEERVAFDRVIGPANAAALAHERLAASAAEVAVATDAVTASTAAEASMFQAAGTGAGRLNQSLRTMELQLLGVQGAAGRSLATFGAFELGSGPLLAIGAAIIVIYEAWKLLAGAGETAAAAAQTLTDKLNATGESFWAAKNPTEVLTDRTTLLTAALKEMTAAASAAPSPKGILAAIIGFAEGGISGASAALGEYYGKLNAGIAATKNAQGEADREAKAAADALEQQRKTAAEGRLRDIQTVADADAALNIAQLKARGDFQAADQAIYDLAVQKHATDVAIAEIAGKLGDVEIKSVQTAKDKLSALTLQEETYKRINALIATALTMVRTPSNQIADQNAAYWDSLPDSPLSPYNTGVIAPLTVDIPKVQKNVAQVGQIYRDLSHDIATDFTTVFENIGTKGLAVFTDLFGTILKQFEKLAADMAAQSLQKSLLDPLFKTGANAIGGSAAGAGVSGAALAGTAEMVAGGAIIGTLISGITAMFTDNSAALQAAALKIKAAQASFALTLQSYVDSTNGATDAIARDQVAATAMSQRTGALTAAGLAPGTLQAIGGFTSGAGAFNTSELLTDTNAQLEALRKRLAATFGGLTPSLDLLITQLETINTTSGTAADNLAKAAAAAKALFVDRIGTDFTASLGVVGTELNQLTALATKRAQDLADATRLGLGDGITSQINSTYTNNATAFLTGLTTAQLDTLIPSLTGDMLALAQGIDVTKHAADAAAKVLTDAATAQTLTIRLATAQGDTALARRLTQEGETAAAIAAKWTPANLALLDLIHTADNLTAAATAAAAAAKLLHDNMIASRNFDTDLLTRQAALSGDAETIRYAKLNVLQKAQADALATMTDQVHTGAISLAQYQAGVKLLHQEWDSAMASFDGTVGGVTTAVHKLAIEAGILANNANQIAQQAHVFGDTPQTQLANYEKIYGYLGTSLDSARALYTKITAGVDLTPAQSAMNSIVDRFVTLYEAANPVITTAAATLAATTGITVPSLSGAATTTYGPSTPIIGPNGTFNITVNVTTQDGQNPTQVGQEIFHALQAEFGRRANLLGDAAGRQ